MLEILVLLLTLLVPGIIGVLIFEFIRGYRIKTCCEAVSLILVFDLLTLLVNLIGLRIVKNISSLGKFAWYLECTSFLTKYIILSIIVVAVLAVIAGIVSKLLHAKKCGIYRNDD